MSVSLTRHLWWYGAIDKLRQQRDPTDPPQLQTFVEVTVGSDPMGWATEWASKFTDVLDRYPTVGEVFLLIKPHFRFTSSPTDQVMIRPDGVVIVSNSVDPHSNVLGNPEYVRWIMLDTLGRLLYRRILEYDRMEYEAKWSKKRLTPDSVTAEDEVAQLFQLVAAGPDEDITAIQQTFRVAFPPRWNWVRQMVTAYVH